MLINLHIENFLIIEKTSIDFTEGLNIISGETGSGKSIIFDAIGLILGDKGSKDFIRNQAEKAFLQATFLSEDLKTQALLEAEGFSNEDLIIISRDLYASGKSLFKVNGRLVTSQFVRQLGQNLINLSGQHENQVLMDIEQHRRIVDEFGFVDLETSLKAISEGHREYLEVLKALEAFQMSEGQWQKETDFLAFQIAEIESAKLKEGEEETLEERYIYLKHFESVQNASEATLNQCKEDEGILSLLNNAKKLIQEVLPYQKELEGPYQQLETAYYAVESATDDLRHLVENMEYDALELEQLEQRMKQIHDLKRKFGKSIQLILEQLEDLSQKLEHLQHYDDDKQRLEKQKVKIMDTYQVHSQTLTKLRKNVALEFQKALIEELKDLNFNQCEFFVEFQTLENITEHGNDRMEFYLSTNPGEPPRPLRKIASGGELSRIMLAVKLVNRKGEFAATQIFDEIDSGISGRTANAVASKLKAISKEGQVILVTHLPQIAVQGDHHLLIDKAIQGQQTKVSIIPMNFEERVSEIARMIGSGDITELTLMSAKEMLINAKA